MNSRSSGCSRSANDQRQSPLLEYTEDEFIGEFRMNKQQVKSVCELVQDNMFTRGSRRQDLTVEEKVLVSLKTLASGSFQNCSKDFLEVSQPTVSKTLSLFTDTMANKAKDFVYMPRNRMEEDKVKADFHAVAGFPGVLGCVDGTHIPIIAPYVDEFAYVNRKKFHSLNIQAICDSNMVFQDVVAKWPGSHHDSFIMEASAIHNKFERGRFGEGWLLGDSGYSLKSWLMTPLTNPTTPRENNYNYAHKKTRSLIERAFGILKSRWRILDHTGGSLCYAPHRVAKIILTCTMLHNICRRDDASDNDTNDIVPSLNVENERSNNSALTTTGIRQRQRLINLIGEANNYTSSS